MLVLTRKTDEEIFIGDDIKITLVRVRGNSVRLGIDAPRDVRIVRGELERHDSKGEQEIEIDLDDCEQVFAHPQSQPAKPSPADRSTNRLRRLMDEADRQPSESESHSIFVGRIHRPDVSSDSSAAPLARFMMPR